MVRMPRFLDPPSDFFVWRWLRPNRIVVNGINPLRIALRPATQGSRAPESDTQTAAKARESTIGTAHPIRRPSLRCLPDLVRGMPIILETLPLRAERPVARRHDHEKPNFLQRLIQSLYTRSSARPWDNNGTSEPVTSPVRVTAPTSGIEPSAITSRRLRGNCPLPRPSCKWDLGRPAPGQPVLESFAPSNSGFSSIGK
jgi:hypothetical protein